jgi:hypothetical protein
MEVEVSWTWQAKHGKQHSCLVINKCSIAVQSFVVNCFCWLKLILWLSLV